GVADSDPSLLGGCVTGIKQLSLHADIAIFDYGVIYQVLITSLVDPDAVPLTRLINIIALTARALESHLVAFCARYADLPVPIDPDARLVIQINFRSCGDPQLLR